MLKINKAIFAKLLMAALILSAFFIPTAEALSDTQVSVGVIHDPMTWALDQSPIVLTNSLALATGATLTIQAGVVVKLQSGVQITTGTGSIDVQGTADQPVIFTSYSDDSFAG